MVRGQTPTSDKMELKSGSWSPEEDQILVSFVQKHGHYNWLTIPKLAGWGYSGFTKTISLLPRGRVLREERKCKMACQNAILENCANNPSEIAIGLKRCGKSCRLRWVNYLRPDVKRGNITEAEKETILKLHESLGNKWAKIASHLPGRTDNEIKNVWYTHLKKRVKSAGNEPEKKSVFSPSSSSDKSSISYCKPNVVENVVKEEDPYEGLLALPATQACGYVNMSEDTPCFPSTASGEEARIEDERWARFLASELVLQDTSYAYSKRLARDRSQM